MLVLRASMGWTPSNIPPSTTVLRQVRHSHFYTHSLHVPLTHLLQVFLRALLPTTPVSFILVYFFTQSFSSFHSTCPNHLNLALWILFVTHSMPKLLKTSSLCFLSFKDTTHPSYHHPLSSPQPSQVLHFHSPCLATIYQHFLNTGIIYFPLQFQRDTPFCKTGASSLNFSQGDRTLVLASSSSQNNE